MARYHFSAELVLYKAEKASWHFIPLPKELSAEIRFFNPHCKKAWGAVPSKVTIGQSTWRTSIFWDGEREAYLLPVKAEIRKREKLAAGDAPQVTLEAGA